MSCALLVVLGLILLLAASHYQKAGVVVLAEHLGMASLPSERYCHRPIARVGTVGPPMGCVAFNLKVMVFGDPNVVGITNA